MTTDVTARDILAVHVLAKGHETEQGCALVRTSDPAPIRAVLPKAEAVDGRTVYRCARGHAHEFLSLAIICDLKIWRKA